MFKKIEKCRICDNHRLEPILDLGNQMLTGVFPRDLGENITVGPLKLVKCTGGYDACGLLQLEHSYDFSEMYGDNYGYRSGLNDTMVQHLSLKVEKLLKLVDLRQGDLVIDIGSNDATTLSAYPDNGCILVGVDPTGEKFRKYYPSHVELIPDFFSSKLIEHNYHCKKAKVVTSFSMLYDLEDPIAFMKQVHEVLEDDGIWVFEQSYMPSMLEMNSFDTVCHEHLEYYALKQIVWMVNEVGFTIIDVEFNSVNGGSFSVVAKKKILNEDHAPVVYHILREENDMGLDDLPVYMRFSKRVEEQKTKLCGFIKEINSRGESICILGASTKGNVLLQYCGLTEHHISCIGEVNLDKIGSFTPGTHIPIVSENDMLEKHPDYLLVLPWHFKKHFVSSKKYRGFKLVFPLPEIEVVSLDR